MPEGAGQRVGVQVRYEIASHGELADPVVRGHVVDGGQFGYVQAHHLRQIMLEKGQGNENIAVSSVLSDRDE